MLGSKAVSGSSRLSLASFNVEKTGRSLRMELDCCYTYQPDVLEVAYPTTFES